MRYGIPDAAGRPWPGGNGGTPAGRAAALTAGTLDASILFRQVAATLVSDSGGAFQIWGGGATAMTPMMWEGFVMSDAFRANTKLSTAFVKAAIDAYTKFHAGDAATMAADMRRLTARLPRDGRAAG